MKSRVGETFEILPDIVNAANSLLFLIFVPTFEYIIYPNLSRMKLLRRPLQRIVVGGVLTGCAYLISGYLELRIQQSHSTLPKANEVMYTFYNGFNFDCSQRFPNVTLINPESRKIIENIHFGHGSYVARRNLENSIFSVSTFRVECDDKTFNFEEQYIDRLSKGVEQDEAEADSARSVIFTGNANGQSGGTIYVAKYPDKVTKSRNGFPFVKFFWSFNFVSSGTISIVNAQNETIHQFAIEATQSTTGMSVGDFPAVKMAATGLHRIHLKIDANLTEIQQRGMDFFDFQFGGNYNIILKLDLLQGVISSSIIFDEITKSNEIHMLWQLPQYIFLTAGEIMLSISSISFAFTEAPQSMKAVVMSMQNLTMAMGDILVVLLTPMLVALFQNQASTFFCFGFLMLVDMLIMAYMANKYQYKNRAT